MQVKRAQQPPPAVRQLHATVLALLRLFENVVEVTRQHSDVRAHFHSTVAMANNASYPEHHDNMDVDPLSEAQSLIGVSSVLGSQLDCACLEAHKPV